MADFPELYQEIGRKIREVREGQMPKLSQQKLATKLELSRASIVNIESGRQHAPVHLLWRIAEALGTDLALLIPGREELLPKPDSALLDAETIKQIKEAAHDNPETIKLLTGVVGRFRATLESKPLRGKQK